MRTPKNWTASSNGEHTFTIGESNYGESDGRAMIYATVYEDTNDDGDTVYRWKFDHDGHVVEYHRATAMDAALDCEDEIAAYIVSANSSEVVALLRGTQVEIAARLGVSQSTVSDWQNDKIEMSRMARHLVIAMLGGKYDAKDHVWRFYN